MRRTLVIRLTGIVLAAAVTLWVGIRHTIQASQNPAVLASAIVGGAFGGDAEVNHEHGQVVHLPAKPMSSEATRVWLKLQEKVAMQFPNDTPLDDVIKYIQESTKDKETFPEGIPFYVDPQGLQDSDKTMASTVVMNLKGIPLATSLGLLLKQIDLEFQIHKDGMVFITSTNSENATPDADAMILDQLSSLKTEIKALRDEIRLYRAPGGTSSDPIPNASDSRPTGGMGGGFR